MTTHAPDTANFSVVRLPDRQPDGKFLPGTGGGRAKGSRNIVSAAAIAAIKSMSDTAIHQLREKLNKGDWDAIVFVLNRILPKGRAIELDAIDATTIASSLASGEVTPEEGAAITATIAKLNEIGELEQLRSRIAELERIAADETSRTA
ncbi:hypothetical protein O7A70_12665 [Mesorhizobium sp. Cs1299R1N1]|uniref:hypothetical protein n=1 Tax=Mesorhizobium sp. Cs1299R1N1 TaxID=3015172 RepID=UPI00301BC200